MCIRLKPMSDDQLKLANIADQQKLALEASLAAVKTDYYFITCCILIAKVAGPAAIARQVSFDQITCLFSVCVRSCCEETARCSLLHVGELMLNTKLLVETMPT